MAQAVQVQVLSRAPIQNEAAFSKPESGTREARPTDFPPFSQTNSACAKKMLFLGVFKNHCRIG